MYTGGVAEGFLRKSMIISLVFPTLTSRRERLHHSANSSTIGSELGESLLSSDTMTENLMICLFLKTLWHSLVHRTNRSGDRTHPCGEAVEDKRISDKAPFTLTFCGLLIKKSINQQIKLGKLERV